MGDSDIPHKPLPCDSGGIAEEVNEKPGQLTQGFVINFGHRTTFMILYNLHLQ
jgi:hypothetical protein